MIPVLDKNSIKVITQNISPIEVEYVTGINSIINDTSEEQVDDIIYVNKIMAFADKFKNLHWAAKSMSYHKTIDDFWSEIENYKDEIAENIQAVIG